MPRLPDDVRPWREGDGDTRCQECGHTYEPWFTDNSLWNSVMSGGDPDGAHGDDPGGFLCPRCFAVRAQQQHGQPIVWRLFPNWRPAAELMNFTTGDSDA